MLQVFLKPLGKWMCAVRMPRFLKRCGALRKALNGNSQRENIDSESEVGQHLRMLSLTLSPVPFFHKAGSASHWL